MSISGTIRTTTGIELVEEAQTPLLGDRVAAEPPSDIALSVVSTHISGDVLRITVTIVDAGNVARPGEQGDDRERHDLATSQAVILTSITVP